MKDKLIILDMDNTILQSRIDFKLMAARVGEMLSAGGFGHCRRQGVAYSMLAFSEDPHYDPELAGQIWDQIGRLENQGLEQAVLEPGVIDSLAYLGRFAELAVLTNNTDHNLADNLGHLGVLPYLSQVAGRDSVPRLKPAPDGLLYLCACYPHLDRWQVVTVGDAVNDAQAAAAAGLKFAAYNRSRMEDWDRQGFSPLLRLREWNRESCDRLLALLADDGCAAEKNLR